MKRIARRAHELSDLIGEDHDLALLAQRANERRDRFSDETAAGELAALELARRLFRKKSRKVARPLEEPRSAA
jgi:hypothetical protein